MGGGLFSPPVTLAPGVSVRTLAEARAYVRASTDIRLPRLHEAMLHLLEITPEYVSVETTSRAFVLWARSQGFLLGDDASPRSPAVDRIAPDTSASPPAG
jgi:hypothetical protein